MVEFGDFFPQIKHLILEADFGVKEVSTSTNEPSYKSLDGGKCVIHFYLRFIKLAYLPKQYKTCSNLNL